MLLPDPMQFKREASGSIDPIRKSFIFDGRDTAFEVPQSVVPASHLLGKRFTLGFWLKHDVQTTKKKEQIICNADGEGEWKGREKWTLIGQISLYAYLGTKGSANIHDVYSPLTMRLKGQASGSPANQVSWTDTSIVFMQRWLTISWRLELCHCRERQTKEGRVVSAASVRVMHAT